MQAQNITWPVKRRDIHNHHMDSTVWDRFDHHDGDVVIATYAKSGTTWMQQIVSQLIFDSAAGVDVAKLSPWIDLRILPPEVIAAVAAQAHRRFVKTHLPADALTFSSKVKYVYVARDGRDVVWSMFNHFANAKPEIYDLLNNTPGRIGPAIAPPPESVHEFYRQWFAGDGYPLWSFWENIRSWWAMRHLPNVKLMHYNDMKRDLAGSIREIAGFLDIAINPERFPDIARHCGFDYMKAHASLAAPLGGTLWEGGAQTFIHKGTNGRWRETLSPGEIRDYEARASAELGVDCAAWVEMGRCIKAVA